MIRLARVAVDATLAILVFGLPVLVLWSTFSQVDGCAGRCTLFENAFAVAGIPFAIAWPVVCVTLYRRLSRRLSMGTVPGRIDPRPCWRAFVLVDPAHPPRPQHRPVAPASLPLDVAQVRLRAAGHRRRLGVASVTTRPQRR